jgi:hypothetical protein
VSDGYTSAWEESFMQIFAAGKGEREEESWNYFLELASDDYIHLLSGNGASALPNYRVF